MKLKRLMAALTFAAAGVSAVSAVAAVDPALPTYEKTSGVSGNLSSVGSDSLANLMTLWAEEFKKQYPNVNIQIQAAGSSTAPPAMTEGTANMGPMSRPMKDSEIQAFEEKYGYKPTAVPVAIDALAVFVHKDNPIKSLSIEQVDAIFSSTRLCGNDKDIKTWGDLGEHVDLRHGDARGDRDFLDHVAQAPQRKIAGVLRDRHAAQLQRHRLAATAQRGDPVQRAQADDRQRQQRGERQHHAAAALAAAEDEPGCRVDGQDDAEHGQREQHHQPRRVASRPGLAFEEVHPVDDARGGGSKPASAAGQNSTFGAARTCACWSAGISSSAAGAKLNMPATMLDGNTSRLLL